MKKYIIFAGIVILVLTIILTTSPVQANYIKIPEYTHSHTKAICTEQNFCQDYEIFCENSNMISMSPITGAAVQFSPHWEDPRTKEMQNKFC